MDLFVALPQTDGRVPTGKVDGDGMRRLRRERVARLGVARLGVDSHCEVLC